MNPSTQTVDVFPITTSAFGLQADWFARFVPKLIHPAFLLMILFLVISVGILALRRFENADIEKKLWNIPVIVIVTAFWPVLVINLKLLIDTFNSFLVHDIFQITWTGFGFPNLSSQETMAGWSAEALARLIPNLAYWVIYAFYIVFFFFFAVLGPFILAKGILFDEVEAFLELLKEITILFLWQTTVVILVAFIMPDIVSGAPFPPNPQANFYFLSLILGIMIFFVPSMTQKFGNHLGHSFFPPGFRMGGAILGLSALGKMGGLSLSAAGVKMAPIAPRISAVKEKFLHAEEFKKRYENSQHLEDLRHEKSRLEHDLREDDDDIEKIALLRSRSIPHAEESHTETSSNLFSLKSPDGDRSQQRAAEPPFYQSARNREVTDKLISLSKRARAEIKGEDV